MRLRTATSPSYSFVSAWAMILWFRVPASIRVAWEVISATGRTAEEVKCQAPMRVAAVPASTIAISTSTRSRSSTAVETASLSARVAAQ